MSDEERWGDRTTTEDNQKDVNVILSYSKNWYLPQEQWMRHEAGTNDGLIQFDYLIHIHQKLKFDHEPKQRLNQYALADGSDEFECNPSNDVCLMSIYHCYLSDLNLLISKRTSSQNLFFSSDAIPINWRVFMSRAEHDRNNGP